MRLTSQRGVSLMLLILAITAFAGVAIGIVTLLRARYESYPYQVQSYQASSLAQAGAEFAVRYARENVDSSGTFVTRLQQLIAATNGRFNLGDGAFQLTYVTSSACKDILYSRGCSTRFNADGTCPGATREVRLQPFGSMVGQAIVPVQITSAISKTHYDYGFGNYSGSRIGFSYCDYTPVYSLNNMYIPHAAIDGQYGPAWAGYPNNPNYGYVGTIAATRDAAGNQVRLGRVGFTGFGSAVLWIWDAACGPCLGPVDGTGQHTYIGTLLPAWDNINHPTPLASEVFYIVPVQHDGTSHTRWPTSGAGLDWTYSTDRPHSGTQCVVAWGCGAYGCDGTCTTGSCNCCVSGGYGSRQDGLVAPTCDGSLPPCCEPYPPGDNISIESCIDTHIAAGYGWASRTEAFCTGEVSGGGGMGLTTVLVQVPGGGNTMIETLGDLACDPTTHVCATFYFRFPYSRVDVAGCENGTNCRTTSPPVYITWSFTVTN